MKSPEDKAIIDENLQKVMSALTSPVAPEMQFGEPIQLKPGRMYKFEGMIMQSTEDKDPFYTLHWYDLGEA